jgi:hypothetical protein
VPDEVSASEENTLTMPLFSATNTRPSGENARLVGAARPANGNVVC